MASRRCLGSGTVTRIPAVNQIPRLTSLWFVALRPAAPSTPDEPAKRLWTPTRFASIMSALVMLATKPIKVGVIV